MWHIHVLGKIQQIFWKEINLCVCVCVCVCVCGGGGGGGGGWGGGTRYSRKR